MSRRTAAAITTRDWVREKKEDYQTLEAFPLSPFPLWQTWACRGPHEKEDGRAVFQKATQEGKGNVSVFGQVRTDRPRCRRTNLVPKFDVPAPGESPAATKIPP